MGTVSVAHIPKHFLPSLAPIPKVKYRVLTGLLFFATEDAEVRIQKHFTLSPRLYFKATEMVGGAFKNVFLGK